MISAAKNWWEKHILPRPCPYGWARIRDGRIPTWWRVLPNWVTHLWVWDLPCLIYRPFWPKRKKQEFTEDDLAGLTPEERKALE